MVTELWITFIDVGEQNLEPILCVDQDHCDAVLAFHGPRSFACMLAREGNYWRGARLRDRGAPSRTHWREWSGDILSSIGWYEVFKKLGVQGHGDSSRARVDSGDLG